MCSLVFFLFSLISVVCLAILVVYGTDMFFLSIFSVVSLGILILCNTDLLLFIILTVVSLGVLYTMLEDLRIIYRNRDIHADGSAWIIVVIILPAILLKNSLDRHVDFADNICYKLFLALVYLLLGALLCIEIYHRRHM